MFEQLGGAEERYQAINDQLMDPNVVSDPKQYAQLMKEYKNLTPIVEKYREYKKAQEDMDEAKMMLEESGLEKDFREKIEVLNSNPTELGGYKEVSFSINGDGAYSKFKFESGVHRVQRVPETETQGRIHTSTVTVAVLPEADEVEVEINPKDLQIDTYRSGGAGGQHVNKTESAIRITHIPTGTVVECQDERSQYKNKDKAMKILRSRIYEKMQREQEEKIASERKLQVGAGDRAERIRTYNYPQGRVTDHRIGLTLYKLEQVLNGDLDELFDALNTFDQAEKLKESSGVPGGDK